MTPRAIWSPHPGRTRTLLAVGFAAFLVIAAAAPPVSATLTSVTTEPGSPTTCDSVMLVVAGNTPTPCYRIVRADLRGPVELPTMGPIPAYEIQVHLVFQESADPDSEACPAVIQPYQRSFDLGRLRPGSYWVRAIETLQGTEFPNPSQTDSLSASFDVRLSEGCPPPDRCYLLGFTRQADGRAGTCDVLASPGGTGCAEITLVNGLPVGGVQTVLDVLPPGWPDAPPVDIHAVSVEPTERAAGFQVAWTTEGSRTRILLYSATGASIGAGRGPIVRVCYAVGSRVTPTVYAIRFGDTVVSDPGAHGLPPCPTFAEVIGRFCVALPGCDLNGDGKGNILDVVHLVNCALAAPGSSEACPDSVAARADCNGDGPIDVRDVVCCVRRILDSGGFGTRDPRLLGEPTGIGFTGSVQWITPLSGRAELTVTPGPDFAGIDFAVVAASSGARIAGMRLASGSGYQLESSIAPDGTSARAMLLSLGQGAGAATVLLDLTPAFPSVGGALTLAGAHSATRLAQSMPTTLGSTTAPVPPVAAPEAPSVGAARPNPFRDQTEITYALPAAARATLRVYSASGRLVRTLVDSDMPAGVHRARWDGRDSSNRTVGSGIYFFRFSAGEVVSTHRMLRLR
jgi:hypothetical protein